LLAGLPDVNVRGVVDIVGGVLLVVIGKPNWDPFATITPR
jgi:hypothetical protein